MGKVLVTGGGGYLGGHVVELLVKAGHEVVILDPVLYGDAAVASFADHPYVAWVRGDANNPVVLSSALRGAKAVIHLAALVGEPACSAHRSRAFVTNYLSIFALLALARRARVERILFTSSCSVYEYNRLAPHPLREDAPLSPRSLYARTRLMSEKVLLKQTDIPVIVFRLATLCGWSRRMRFDLVANQMTLNATQSGFVRVVGGHRYRPLLHVRDAARAIVLAIEAPIEEINHEIFNVGANDHNWTLSELGKAVAEAVPATQLEEFHAEAAQRGYAVDFTKITERLAFRPLLPIADCIAEVGGKIQTLAGIDWSDPRYYNVRALAARRRLTMSHALRLGRVGLRGSSRPPMVDGQPTSSEPSEC